MFKNRRLLAGASGEDGQAVILFVAGFLLFLGFVGLSVDVGRFMWAKSELQATVDSAALAGAQSMPEGEEAAESFANAYWESNKGGIVGSDPDASFLVSFPSGNRAVRTEAEADIPTWFVRFFGVPSWHVEASGKAESQVLDIAVVLDISSSMCFTSYPPTENELTMVMSPGRRPASLLTPAGGFLAPRLLLPVTSTSGSTTTLYLNDVRVFTSTSSSTNRANFGDSFNTSTPYWNYNPSGSARPGMIMIDDEIFQITAVNTTLNTLSVKRGQSNLTTGLASPKQTHSMLAEVWSLHSGTGGDSLSYCENASPFLPSLTVNGPHEPFDSAMANASYFVSLFNEEYDRLSVVKFGTKASIVQALTYTHSTLDSAMDSILAPNGMTNIAHGIAQGKKSLDSARPNGKKIIVVLTDGVPNVTCSDYTGSCSSYTSYGSPTNCAGTQQPLIHAKQQAALALASGIQVYTIGLGDGVVPCSLQQIATAGGGEYLEAPTTAQLDDAFYAIAVKTHIGLTD